MRARRLIALSSVIAGCVAVFAITAHNAGAYQHVRNGGFESGTDGWWTRNDTLLAASGEAAPVEGNYAGRVTLAANTFELHPSMSGTIAPGAYEFSAYVLAADPGITLDVAVGGRGFEESRSFELASGAWTRVAVPVDAHLADDPVITIAGSGAPGDTLYIDAVRLDGVAPVTRTPTPSPTLPSLVPAAEATAARSATPSPQPSSTPILDVIAGAVRNPSFEEVGADGQPLAWRKFGGELASVTAPVRSGAHAARLDSTTGSMKWLYQAVHVEPGGTYAFDASIWHDDPDVASAFLRISWYASADAGGESIATSDSTSRLDAPVSAYRQITTGPVTAPDDARSAKLRIILVPLSSVHASIVVDDVAFAPAIPPPPAPPASEDEASGAPPAAGSSARRLRGGASGAGPQIAAHDGLVSTSSAALIINEVLYDADTGGPDAADEWVEIYNRGDANVSLAGWTLRDHARAVPLPDIVVPARGFAVIAASDSFFERYPAFDGIAAWLVGRIGNGLGNDGDLLELVAPSGAVIDAVSWDDDASALDPPVDAVAAGHSIERSPAGADTDVAGDFIDNAAPSPGRAFVSADSNPKQQLGQRTVEIIQASGGSQLRWVPWALVALSGAALAGALGWRALDAVRSRTPSP